MSVRSTILTLGLSLCATTFAAPLHAVTQAPQECPAAQKVTGLLADWKQASQEAQKASPESRAALAAQTAKIASSCPICPRMAGTLPALRDTLAAAVAINDELKQHCPLEKSGADEKLYAEVKPMKLAHEQMLRQLRDLAEFAAASCCESGEGAAKTAAKTSAQDAACEAEASCCPIRIAARLGGLKAEWAAAAREAAAITPAKREELLAAFTAIASQSKTAQLMPATITALVEGFEALDKVHAEMKTWAQAHPEVMKDIPQSAMMACGIQTALLDEARQVLVGATKAMQAMQGKAPANAAGAGTVARQ